MKNPDKTLYFMAIIPDRPVSEEVKELKQHMAEHYNCTNALKSPAHITLFPPFVWEEKDEQLLIDHLSTFANKQKKFRIILDGFGCFPPKVIFVRVEKNTLLEDLQKKLVDHIFNAFTLNAPSLEKVPFQPHMTIANRDLKEKDFPQAWGDFRNEDYFAEFEAHTLYLLKHNGKIWNIIKAAPLAAKS